MTKRELAIEFASYLEMLESKNIIPKDDYIKKWLISFLDKIIDEKKKKKKKKKK